MVFLLVLLIFIIFIIFSKIRIEISNLKFSSIKIKSSHLNDNYILKIKLLILNKIPIFKINITKEKLQKLNFNEKIKNMDFKLTSVEKNLNKETIKEIKNIDFQINKIKLRIDLGTESTILTSILIPTLSTVISIILSRKQVKVENQRYEINPIYNNGNLVNITLEGIFEIKVIHIIKVIYIINKKRRVDRNERTSDRRPYGYSYE